MMEDEKNVNFVKAMRVCNLLSVVCMVVTLNACVSQAPEWTESDEKWWSQSETFPNQIVTTPVANKEVKHKLTANQLKEPAVTESTIIKSGAVDTEQNKDIVATTKEAQEVKSIKLDNAANVMAVSADTELKSEINAGLMHLPAEYFTVQLLASADMKSVNRFVKKHQVPKSFVVMTEKNKVIWYVLLLDVFDSYELAMLASKNIARSMQESPWIRNIGSVQQILKK